MPHEHDNTQAYIRAALYVGVFMLLGAGVFVRYVGREAARAQRWRLWYMLSGGFVLALGATLYGVYHVTWMLGDPSLMGSYLTETTQGHLLLARLGLLAGLLALSMGWFRLDRWVYPPLALGLLLTLTLTSHAGAGGGPQVLAGLLHLGFAVVWGGSVLALAVAWPGTRYEAVRAAISRLSALGLLSLGAVALAGLYLASARLETPGALLASDYGRRLLLKLGLVGLVVGLAAVNRLWLLPRLRAKQTRGLPTVSAEALLIAGVLVASGVLASTEPPARAAQAAPSLVNIDQTLGDRRYVGQLLAQGGLIHLFLDVRDARGELLEGGPALRLRAENGDDRQEDAPTPYTRSQYHTALIAQTPGDWTVRLELPGKTLEYALGVPPLR